MLHRLAWIATSAALAGALSAGACTVENEDHCANREGDQTCADLYGSGVVCSRCEAAHNGCVEDPPTEACAFTPADTTVASTATTVMTGASADSSGPSTSTSTSGTTGSSTTFSTTSTETTGPTSMCSNGVKEPGEACDGEDFGDLGCNDFQGARGDLTCTPDCLIDTSSCSGSKTAECQNDMLDEGEACDPSAPDPVGGQECAELTGGVAKGGSPACSGDCQLTTATCCLDPGSDCGLGLFAEYECCGGSRCVLTKCT